MTWSLSGKKCISHFYITQDKCVYFGVKCFYLKNVNFSGALKSKAILADLEIGDGDTAKQWLNKSSGSPDIFQIFAEFLLFPCEVLESFTSLGQFKL